MLKMVDSIEFCMLSSGELRLKTLMRNTREILEGMTPNYWGGYIPPIPPGFAPMVAALTQYDNIRTEIMSLKEKGHDQ